MRTTFPLACALLGLLLASCSANSEGGSSGYGGAQAGSGGGGGNGGTDSDASPYLPDSSTGGGGGDGALPVNPEAAMGDVPLYDGDNCSAVSVEAEPFPLDMYVMMDQSGSMSLPVVLTQPFGPTQWDAVKGAFDGFLSSTPPTGMSMGIQYFPLPIAPWNTLPTCSGSSGCSSSQLCADMDTGSFCMAKCNSDGDCPTDSECMSLDDGNGGTVKICSNDTCNSSKYAEPEVPIGAIPGVNQAIINSLNAHSPASMTPSAPALEGAISYTKDWATQHPGHTSIVVFATDGQPTVCTDGALQPVNKVKQIAADGLNGTPSIKTFVIGVVSAGMPGMAGALDGIAYSGGTGKAFVITPGQNMTAQFAAALEAIRGAFMECEFKIPNPGLPLDFGEVNVVYTATNGDEYLVYYVGDPSQCDPTLGGWYYDVDPANGTPTKILLCPQSCQFVQNYSGKIDIKIGCVTIEPPK